MHSSNRTTLTRTTFKPFLTDARSSLSKLTSGSWTRIRNGSRPSMKTTTSTIWPENTIRSLVRSDLKKEFLTIKKFTNPRSEIQETKQIIYGSMDPMDLHYRSLSTCLKNEPIPPHKYI